MAASTAADLLWAPLREQARALDGRDISSVELLTAHFERIEQINSATNAVVTMSPDRAFAAAAEADRRRAAREDDLPPLLGVPMTHKDTHDVSGIRTTCGSTLFADRVPDRSAPIVSALQAAGVVSSGKTNVPEFAAGAHTFNSVFGTTLNPYDTTRSASGSSGGAAVAIACGVQAAGDGSDTGGSLRLPASFANIVGLRPSRGQLRRCPPDAPWVWLSQAGFMARRTEDVAWLMELCGGTPARGGRRSDAFSGRPGRRTDDFTGRADTAGETAEPDLRGTVIGWLPSLGGRIEVETEVLDILDAAGTVLDSLGTARTDDVPDLEPAREVFRTARAYEFAGSLGGLHRRNPGVLKPSLAANIDAGLALTVDDLFSHDRARTQLHATMAEYFRTHDVLITTTSQVLPFPADQEFATEINGSPMADYLAALDSTTLISATGCPAVSVPAGFSASGLPVGMQIIGPVGADARVLEVARHFEAATGFGLRRPPL